MLVEKHGLSELDVYHWTYAVLWVAGLVFGLLLLSLN
jgi:hypothetical protein